MLSRYGFRFEENNGDSDGYKGTIDADILMLAVPFYGLSNGAIGPNNGYLRIAGNTGFVRAATPHFRFMLKDNGNAFPTSMGGDFDGLSLC